MKTQSQGKWRQLLLMSWGSNTCFCYFPRARHLNWRVFKISARPLGAVTIEDLRSYINIKTLRGKNPTEIYSDLHEVCGELTTDHNTVSSWATGFRDGRISLNNDLKTWKAENINKQPTCETCWGLSSRRSSSDVRRNMRRYRDSINIRISYFDKRFAHQINVCLVCPSLLDCWTERETPWTLQTVLYCIDVDETWAIDFQPE